MQCLRRVAIRLVLLRAGAPALAQSRPLVTEDPETVPVGNLLLEAGVDYQQDAIYPASGLRGNLWRIGTFGLSIGVSSIAEIQIDGGLAIGSRSSRPTRRAAGDMLDVTGDSDAATSRISRSAPRSGSCPKTARRPVDGGAVRDAAAERQQRERPRARHDRLSTSGSPSAKTVQSVRVVGNVGFGILGRSGSRRSSERRARLRRVGRAGGGAGRRDRRRVERPAEHPIGRAAARHRQPVDDARRRALHARPGPRRWRADRSASPSAIRPGASRPA